MRDDSLVLWILITSLNFLVRTCEEISGIKGLGTEYKIAPAHSAVVESGPVEHLPREVIKQIRPPVLPCVAVHSASRSKLISFNRRVSALFSAPVSMPLREQEHMNKLVPAHL